MNMLIVGSIDPDFVNKVACEYLGEFDCSLLFAKDIQKAKGLLATSNFIDTIVVVKSSYFNPKDEDIKSLKNYDKDTGTSPEIHVCETADQVDIIEDLHQFEDNLLEGVSSLAENLGLAKTQVLVSEHRTKRYSRREKILRDSDHSPSAQCLTNRQKDVLALLCEGLSNREIAKRLYTAESTIKVHCKAIYKSLGVGNRTQAVTLALRQAFDKT